MRFFLMRTHIWWHAKLLVRKGFLHKGQKLKNKTFAIFKSTLIKILEANKDELIDTFLNIWLQYSDI